MPETFSIEVKGLDAALRELGALIQKLGPAVMGDALETELEVEATEAKRRCPVDTGALRGSITVDRATVSAREVSCRIYAGGPAAGYALHVHENLEAFHRVGEAKFIERPLHEAAPHLAQRIARRLAQEAGV